MDNAYKGDTLHNDSAAIHEAMKVIDGKVSDIDRIGSGQEELGGLRKIGRRNQEDGYPQLDSSGIGRTVKFGIGQ